MKKILNLFLCGVLVATTLSGCAKPNDDQDMGKEPPIQQETENQTVGYTMSNKFLDYVENNPDKTVLEIAEALATDEYLPFMGASTEVEPGLLNGFDNYEINGFEKGAMFAPMIGTIPFMGYIFKLAEDADVEAFKTELSNNANLRWNICTEAEQLVLSNKGNIVFFLMTPEKFEEPKTEENTTDENTLDEDVFLDDQETNTDEVKDTPAENTVE